MGITLNHFSKLEPLGVDEAPSPSSDTVIMSYNLGWLGIFGFSFEAGPEAAVHGQVSAHHGARGPHQDPGPAGRLRRHRPRPAVGEGVLGQRPARGKRRMG